MRTPVAFKRFEIPFVLQTIVKKKMCIKENTSFLFHNYVQNCQGSSFGYARAFKNYYIKMIWWLFKEFSSYISKGSNYDLYSTSMISNELSIV